MNTSTSTPPRGKSQAIGFVASAFVLLYFFGRASIQKFPPDAQHTVASLLEWILIFAMVCAGVHLGHGLVRWISAARGKRA